MSVHDERPAGRAAHATVAPESKVKIRDLHKKFGRTRVLRGVNLDFNDEAITTILGPSGTGKSVLLKHIVGLLAPDRGDVVVFNQNIWGMSEAQRNELRKKFGVLFQDGALFGSMSVYNNVAFPLRKNTAMEEDQIRQVVMQRLEEVGLGAAVDRFPAELSGGMKKRAGFARALVTNPQVVMFDEPDSGLDPVRTTLLCKLIREVHAEHGGTYVVVSHDINTVRTVSDYVAVLWHGEIVHNGTKDDAFNSQDPFVKQFLSGGAEGPLGME